MFKFRTIDYDANNQIQIVLPAGNYRGIGLSWEFTNLAGQTLDLSELGFLRLYSPEGGKLWDVTLERLYGWFRRKFPGIQRTNSTAGNAGEHFIYVPFNYPHDHNIVRLGTGYVLEFQHNDITGDTTTGLLTLMLSRGLGIQRYFPLYNDFNIRSLSAEVTPENYPRKNLSSLAIVPSNNHTVIKLIKDGNIIYDCTDEQIEFVVNLEQEHQTYVTGTTASTPWILDLYKDGNLAEVLGHQYEFGVVSTDATIQGMDVQLVMTEAAMSITSEIASRVKEKNAATEAEKVVA